MTNKIRNTTCIAALLSLACATPSQALEKWHAGLIGAGATAAAIIAIEHFVVPYIINHSHQATERKQAAELTGKQELFNQMKRHYAKDPFAAAQKCDELLDAKQKVARDLRTIQNAYDQYKSSKLQNAEGFLKELDECKHTLQQRDAALDQAIARNISDEASAYYAEELKAMKTNHGLDAETLERIVAENHARDPYRRHTYLSNLDKYIERCRQLNAPSMVTNTLEVLRKQSSRLLEPKIAQERHDREEADRRAQEFEVDIANKKSIKEYIDSAKQDIAHVNAMAEESRNQNERFAAVLQQQCSDNVRAVSHCTTAVKDTNETLFDVQQQQQDLQQHVNQLDKTIREQNAQTQNMIHTELAQIINMLHQQQNNQPYNAPAPSAPPFD